MHIYDLLVVGAGPAGLSAALSAFDLGIENCLLLEKEDALGGRLTRKQEAAAGSVIFQKMLGSTAYLKHFLKTLSIYDLPTMVGQSVARIAKDEKGNFALYINEGKSPQYLCRRLIFAGGADSLGCLSDLLAKAEPSEAPLPGLYLVGDCLRRHVLPDYASQAGAACGRKAAAAVIADRHRKG